MKTTRCIVLCILTCECISGIADDTTECRNGIDVSLTAPLGYNEDNSQYIKSPKYPFNYPRNTVCGFYIEAIDSGNIVFVKVVDIFMENLAGSCGYDNFLAFDGPDNNSKLLGSTCYEEVSYESSGKQIYIQFQSDSKKSHRGFNALYYSKQPTRETEVLSAGGIAGVSIGAFVLVFCIIELILCNWERVKRLFSCCCQIGCCVADTADCREANGQLQTISIADPENLEDRIRHGLEPDEQRPVTPRNILPYETPEINPSHPPPSYDEVMANTHRIPSAPPEQKISYVPSKPPSATVQP